MNKAMPKYHSLKRKMLVPLVLVLIVLVSAALVIIYQFSELQLEKRSHSRAMLLANMVNYSAESISNIGELQRIVTALGAEEDVLEIVVAGGKPLQVIASTRNIWRGRLLSELPQQEFADDLLQAISQRSAHSHYNATEKLYDYSAPLLLSNIEKNQSALVGGAVMVHVDTRPIGALVGELTVKLTIGFVMALALISLLGYVMLKRMILLPLEKIDSLIKVEEHRKDFDLWRDVLSRDEIGRVAQTLFESLEKADTALHDLAVQKDELFRSEERYRLMADYSSDIIFRAALDGTLTYISPASAAVLGYESASLLGRSLLEYVHPDDRAQTVAQFELMTNTWQLQTVTCRFLTVEGQYLWMETSLRCVQQTSQIDGKEVVGVSRDITLRKHTEAMLEKTSRLLGNVLDSASEVSIIATDVAGIITVFNHGAEKLLGYRAEEVIGNSTPAMFHLPEEVIRRGQELSVILGYPVGGFRTFVELPEKQGAEQREWTYVTRSGKRVPVSLVVTTMHERDGAISGYLGIAQDISLRITAEYALKEQALHTRAILDNMVDGIITIDTNGVIDSINPAVEHIFGYAAQELIGRNVKILMPMPYREQHDGYLQQYQKTRTARVIGIGREVEGQRKDGHTFPLDLAVSEITRQGRVMYVGMVRDITERKRIEKMKSEFVSVVSHELRTPMNAILGFTQLLGYDDNITDKQRSSLQKVKKAGEHLLSIINDVLDLSRIEAGKITLSLEPVVVGTVLEECRHLLLTQASNRNIQLHLDCAQLEDICVHADRTRFRQIMLNLMSNAIKYNRAGGHVWVSAKKWKSKRIRIEVRDDGPGISKEKQTELFQPFNRLGAECSDIEGTGIGLTITRQLVEMMHGEIGLISESGEGSTFWIELAQDSAEVTAGSSNESVEPQQIQSRLGQYRVLYIEDNPVNLEFVQALCEQFWPNMQLLSASSAEVGLELAAEQHPQLILLDINLPGIDGYEALARLKADPVLQQIPVVAVTANAAESNIQHGLQMGFVEYLTKPIDLPRLLNVIDKLLLNSQPLVPVVQMSKRLLLAEDNIVNQEIARGMLEMLGYEIDVVEDGRAAVEAADRTHYAAILMDCEMPIMDGYAATAAIRNLEGSNRRTPIIAVTAHLLEENYTHQQAAGMDDYLAKPLQLENVRQKLASWIGKSGSAEKPKQPHAVDDVVLDSHITQQLATVLGVRAVAIIDSLVRDTPMHLELLRAAIDCGDVATVRAEAHTIKGSSSNLGALRFAELCEDLSTHCKAGELDKLPDTYAALLAEFNERVVPALEQFKQALRQQKTAS